MINGSNLKEAYSGYKWLKVSSSFLSAFNRRSTSIPSTPMCGPTRKALTGAEVLVSTNLYTAFVTQLNQAATPQ